MKRSIRLRVSGAVAPSALVTSSPVSCVSHKKYILNMQVKTVITATI
jgi:hypothetical protein